MLNPAAPFRAALRQRNLRLLFAGLVASQAGDWLYNLALLALVYDRTGSSALWLGVTTTAARIAARRRPRSDRRRPRRPPRPPRADDRLRRPARAATHGRAGGRRPRPARRSSSRRCSPRSPPPPGRPTRTCVVAVMPRLGDDDLCPPRTPRASTITHVCIVAGPAVRRRLLLLGSPATAFAVNGATFLVGDRRRRRPAARGAAPPGQADAGPPARLRSDLAAGWRALRACDPTRWRSSAPT